jgi:DNA primase
VLLLYPLRTPAAKVEALNYLLSYIRRIPDRITRDEFATDAAQKLGIDSALVREELKQVVAKQRNSLSNVTPTLSEAEKVLLRALAGALSEAACQAAAAGFDANEVHFEGLTVASLLKQLRHRGAVDPMHAIEDPAARSLLAKALNGEMEPISPEQVTAALDTLRHRHLERRQRELRAAIGEAERKGDAALVVNLTAEKLSIDRALREF